MVRLLAAVSGSIALWILFVSGVKPEEMIVGAICTLLTVVFSWYVATQCSLRIRLRWIDVVQIWRFPWYVITGTWEVLRVLTLDIIRVAPAESLFRAAPFERNREENVGVARRVLAVAYTTATPNFIILGIDPKTRRMLFHQLKKTGVLTITRRLGAQA